MPNRGGLAPYEPFKAAASADSACALDVGTGALLFSPRSISLTGVSAPVAVAVPSWAGVGICRTVGVPEGMGEPSLCVVDARRDWDGAGDAASEDEVVVLLGDEREGTFFGREDDGAVPRCGLVIVRY